MEHQWEDLRLLQDSFWRERVFGFRELPDEKISARMTHLQLNLSGPFFCVILFAPYLMEKDAESIDDSLSSLLHSIREEYQDKGIECYTISDNYCNVVAILSLQSEKEYFNINELTTAMTSALISRNEVDMFVGIGEIVDRISLLRQSKDSAAEALSHKFAFSQSHIILAKDVKRFYNQGNAKLKVHYDWILGCFYDGNLERMAIRLHNLILSVEKDSANALESVQNVCIELTATLIRIVREMGVDGTEEIKGIYTTIAHINNIPQIEEWFLAYCSELLNKVIDLRKNKTQQILEIADSFIIDNLGDHDLSIQAISDRVGLSAPYFSNIFFKTKGVHINEYINRCRIEQAQRMLSESNEKVSIISYKLGFTSPNYFNSIFKRYTGITPKRFRETCYK